MPGPLPRWLTGCAYPFLPLSRRPSPKVYWVGCTTTFRSTTSERGGLTRLQSFDYLQASEFACHPGRPHRWHRKKSLPGRPWRLHPSKSRFVASPRIGHTSRPNRAIDGRGLSPPRSTALLAATRLGPPITIDVITRCYTLLGELFDPPGGARIVARLKERDELPRWNDPEEPSADRWRIRVSNGTEPVTRIGVEELTTP